MRILRTTAQDTYDGYIRGSKGYMEESSIQSRSTTCHGPSWMRSLLLKLMILATVSCLLPVHVIANDSSPSLFIVEQHVDEEGQMFSHLTVDKTTGTVYAGGVNHLYQFDSNLKLLHHVVTGPVNDSVHCPAKGCRDGINVKVTDNVNKVLSIDYTRNRIITCGTVHQGSCQVRDLENISHVYHNVLEPIVANSESASTVAFIAPGPLSPPSKHVMYIGVTYTGKSVYRNEVPAIATRSLEDLNFLEIAITDVTTSTRMYVNSLARERYPITYVYGFSSENFSYFLTQQAESTQKGSPFISKLVRVCQNDSSYYSYTEIPIECKTISGRHYNLAQSAYLGKPGADLASELGIQTSDDVLFVVFSPSEGNGGSAIPADKGAICVYSMKSVRRMFIQNIQNCFRGRGDRGLDFISPSHRCIETRINDLNEDFCGMDVNTPLGGEQPVESTAVLTFTVRLTAIVAVPVERSTAVFLGTADGHIQKVMFETLNEASDFSDIVVDEGSSVGQDMFFDKEEDHLYIFTRNKISKVGIRECGMYGNCSQCLSAHDLFASCGWCTLGNKCSTQRDCRKVDQDLQYWVSYETGQCTTVTQVMPSEIQITTARTLSLTIDNIPPVERALQCVFSVQGHILSTYTKRTSQGVSCTTPRTDFLPEIPENEHDLVTSLSVSMSQGPELASTYFTFFDCRTYSTCTECVSSPFPCDWCVDGYRCTHDSAENCRNDVLVNGVNRVGPSIRSGPSFCPRITLADDDPYTTLVDDDKIVASGTEKSIKVKVAYIAQFITQTRFVCQFNIKGRIISVNANLLSDTIYCDRVNFTYNSMTPTINATFSVIWGGSKPLDNPHNIAVLVYKCHQMADDCRMCSILPEHLGCGWCQSTETCQVNTTQCSSWLTSSQRCPRPNITITDFHSKSELSEGGESIRESDAGSCSGLTELRGEVTSLKTVVQEMKEVLRNIQKRVNSNRKMLQNLTMGHGRLDQ